MVASSKNTTSPQDAAIAYLRAQETAMLSDYRQAKAKADADPNALIMAAVKGDEDYPKVQELQAAYVNALEALKAKVSDSVSIPTDEEKAQAESTLKDITIKIRDSVTGVANLLGMNADDIFSEEFREIAASKKNRKGSSNGPTSLTSRKLRLGYVRVFDQENPDAGDIYRVQTVNDTHPTITEIAEHFDMLDNEAILTHVPSEFSKKSTTCEFVISLNSPTDFDGMDGAKITGVKHLGFEMRYRQ